MHSGFIHQDTNTKVSMIFNNNRSFSAESEEPNTIITFIFSGGRYEYIVQYANPVGNLKSRGARTLSDAVADAKSGERSTSTTFKIDSYWGGNLVGVLECAKLELYRRLAAPYEDLKIEDNGDVYNATN